MQTRCRADRVKGKATRVGSFLVARTTEDSAATREGIPAGHQSSERPEVPKDASPETASSRTVTTRARDRQQRRQAAADDRAGVDDTTVTVPLHRVGGSRRASTETAETVPGRPGRAGLRQRRRKLIWVIPGMSGRIRPDQTGSDRIKPDQVKPTRNLPKLNPSRST